MSAALSRTFQSLQVPNYRRYFAGQVISISGNWMQMVAEMWLVVKLTHSGLAVGIAPALQFLPILFFGGLGGVLVFVSNTQTIVEELSQGVTGTELLWPGFGLVCGSLLASYFLYLAILKRRLKRKPS